MNLIARIRTEVAHVRGVHTDHHSTMQRQAEFDAATTNEARTVAAERIADLLDSQAYHLEASRWARWTVLEPAPVVLRTEAALWRARSVESSGPLVDADGIPIYNGPGPGVAPCCWVNPGQSHSLSCDHVTMEQFEAWRTRQTPNRSS